MKNTSDFGSLNRDYDFFSSERPEHLIIEEATKGQATEMTRWNYYYFRTKNCAEVDLILEGSFVYSVT